MTEREVHLRQNVGQNRYVAGMLDMDYLLAIIDELRAENEALRHRQPDAYDPNLTLYAAQMHAPKKEEA